MAPVVRKVKYEMSIWLKAPNFPTSVGNDGSMIAVNKLVIVSNEGKAFVEVSGRMLNGLMETRSKRYNLSSYSYPDAPDWIVELVADAGYAFPIDRAPAAAPTGSPT